MAPSFLFTVLDQLTIAVQSLEAPTEAEWRAYVEAAYRRPLRGEEAKFLVVTDGGAPSLAQQRELNAIIAGITVRVAILSSAPGVLQAVRHLQLHNPDTRAFAPDAIEAALAYLEIAGERWDEIKATIAELQGRLGQRHGA